MKSIFKVVVAPFLWLVQGCNPLGDAFNEELSNNHYYNNSKTDIIYSPMGNSFALGKSAMQVDIGSFKVLNSLVSKDKNRVYFEANMLKNKTIDLPGFHVRPGLQMTNIGLDNNNVYWLETTYKDGNSFAMARLIPGADPATFEQIDFDWAKDDTHHFFKHKIVNVDYQSFKNIHPYFSTDKEKVYRHHGTVFTTLEADVATFELLEGSDYARDQNHIYYLVFDKQGENTPQLKSIPIAKGDELKVHNTYYLSCGTKIYFGGREITTSDINSFEVVSERYAKDKDKVYFEFSEIPDADSATFRIWKSGLGVEDKHGRYINGKLAKD